MNTEIVKQEFIPKELDDIKEIALYLRQYKYSYPTQLIIRWAVDEFLRRKYCREHPEGCRLKLEALRIRKTKRR